MTAGEGLVDVDDDPYRECYCDCCYFDTAPEETFPALDLQMRKKIICGCIEAKKENSQSYAR